MELFSHRFPALFAQLGLPNEEESIKAFIEANTPLADSVRLEDAPFWTAGQAQMLGEELKHNADWAEVIDQLSLALRRYR